MNVGICYLDGLGTEKNKIKAKKWLTIASEHGSQKAKQIIEYYGL